MAKRRRNPLYYPSQRLEGRPLRRASRALTKLEIRPQAKAYGRLARELNIQRGATNLGLQRLGDRATGITENSYQNLARSTAENVARQNAIGDMLRQRTGEINQQAESQLGGASSSALGSYLESLQGRGAPTGGAAQQELARSAQAEQDRMVASGQAASNFANSQAASYGQMASSQGAASQQRGREGVSEIQRMIASRVAENNLRAGADIREAKGKRADILALRGPTRIKNLLEMRETERDYGLGKAAVGVDKASLREEARHNRAQENIDLIDAQNDGSGGGGGGGSIFDSPADRKAAAQAARGHMLDWIGEHGGNLPGNPRERSDLFKAMKGEGVPAEANRLIRRIYRRYKRKHT